jgi:hypothetical protein
VGVILSVTGWLMQAEGTRWMHWTAGVLQLSLTIAMIVLRARLRRSLVTNPKVHQICEGHELDWLSMHVANADTWEVSRFESDDEDDHKNHNHKRKIHIHPNLRTIDSEPSCNIVATRIHLTALTFWNGAVDDVAQNLAHCI